jgi:hypothetical protein
MNSRETILTIIILLIALTLWVTLIVLPAVNTSFFRDDYGFSFASRWANSPLQFLFAVQTDDTWRPLTAVSWWLGWQWFGEEQWMYALPNWLWLFGTCLLWIILWRRWKFTGPLPMLFAGMLLCHPVADATASWRDAVGDMAGGFFWMAAFLAYLGFRQKSSLRQLAISIGCLVASLLFKENAVTFPLVLAAWELWGWERVPGNQRLLARTVPFFIVVMVYLGFRYLLVGSLLAGSGGYGFSQWTTRLSEDPLFPVKIWGRLFWAKAGILPGTVGIAAAIVLFLLAKNVIHNRGRSRPFLFLFMWLILTVIPVSPALPTVDFSHIESARIIYLPMIAVLATIGWAVGKTFRGAGQIAIGTLFLFIFILLGWNQTKAWADRVQADQTIINRVEQSIRSQGGGVGEREVWMVENGACVTMVDYALKYRDPRGFGQTVVWSDPGPEMLAIPEELWNSMQPGIVNATGYGHQDVKIGPYHHVFALQLQPERFNPDVMVRQFRLPE